MNFERLYNEWWKLKSNSKKNQDKIRDIQEQMIEYIMQDEEWVYQLDIPRKNDLLNMVIEDPTSRDAVELILMYKDENVIWLYK